MSSNQLLNDQVDRYEQIIHSPLTLIIILLLTKIKATTKNQIHKVA